MQEDFQENQYSENKGPQLESRNTKVKKNAMDKDTPMTYKTDIPYGIDVPVLLEFFNRPWTFEKVFARVRKVRPSILFLYQDGVRPGRSDEDGHAKCRKIAENIDWCCTVYRYYQTENKGCDPSGFLAQRWAFSHVDRCIVLEDDCVPALSFFPYCKELLERYKDEPRANIICGMNNLGTWEPCGDSYFFGRRGSIWGWASWSRVVLDWREDYDWVSDRAYIETLQKRWNPCRDFAGMKKRWKYCAGTNKPYFEVLLAERMLRRDALNIIPQTNMIRNVGLLGGTHSDVQLNMLPRFTRRWMELEAQEIEFPLQHPDTIVQDTAFDRAMDPNLIQRLMMRPERIFLQLIHGNGKVLWHKLLLKLGLVKE